ncbi:MAG: DUF6076 domain-containing protein [Clostridiales Family XIII bacterium]|nr:DUF6076 domain-containing protein [Clostridiales Family XIII bacterium]
MDLFNISDDFFEFAALFSESGVIINERSYKCGQILTEFLNYDSSEYRKRFKLFDYAWNVVHGTKHDNFEDHREGFFTMQKVANSLNEIIYDMPLYRDFDIDKEYLEKIFTYDEEYIKVSFEKPDDERLKEEMFLAGINPVIRSVRRYYDLMKALDLIDVSYRQLIKILHSKNADYATILSGFDNLLCNNPTPENDFFADKTTVTITYETHSDISGKPEVFEKMAFKSLGDFIFVEVFKSVMRGSAPKKCKNCGRYFLLEKGYYYEFCEGAAPDEDGKTCRDVGATKSFRDKVKNNPIWEAHQRAYKKYYARILKKTMSKPDFNDWAGAAGKIRDRALAEWEKDQKKPENERAFDLNAYVRELNYI